MSNAFPDFSPLHQELIDALLALEKSLGVKKCDLVIGHGGVNHGLDTGVMLRNIFADSSDVRTICSDEFQRSRQGLGARQLIGEGAMKLKLVHKLDGDRPRRVFLVPCCPEDYILALAVKDFYRCPLAVFVMEDQLIDFNDEEEVLAQKLFDQADLCLGSSQPLCEAYTSKFKHQFWFLPPVIERRLIQTQAPNFHKHNLTESKGLMIGNTWSQAGLKKLCHLCHATGIELEWYGEPDHQLLFFQGEELAKNGIMFRGAIPADELVVLMRAANFAVVPTDSADRHGNGGELTRRDLPYSICLTIAAANLPILVLGNPNSAIAAFILSHGLGLVSRYQAGDFRQTIDEILQRDNQKKMRRRSLLLGQHLSADGIAPWIWESLAQGQPRDERFQNLQNSVTVDNASVVITLNEVTPRHGTGALVRRVFPDDHYIISIRLNNDYGGDHAFGAQSYYLPHYGWSRGDIFSNVADTLADQDISRIFCVPYGTADVLTAIAVKELFDIPLGIWIMDDQNIRVNNIPDELMREFLEKADIRFATHPELREVYENKFGLKFWILPAVVPHGLIKTEMFHPSQENCQQRRGALLGSIWSQQWFADLCHSMKNANVQLNWYGNSKYPWLTESDEDLRALGLYPQGLSPELELVQKLRKYPFVLVPTGTMDERDDQPQFSQLSLPGRILFALATSNTPVILMGSPQTSAASFVSRFQIGLICDYTLASLETAVAEMLDPQRQRIFRENAIKVAEKFSDRHIDAWIWDSLAQGQAADNRFESLFRRSPMGVGRL